MKEYRYNITLHSQIGKRHGTLNVIISDSGCEGTIFIMENHNNFSGTFSNGKWHLKMNLITGIWTTECFAFGDFYEDKLEFEVQILGGKYYLSGERSELQ